MERAGTFLGHVVRRIDRPQATFAWLAGSWAAVVGNALAAHTRPVRCENHCLELATSGKDGKAWQNQLECMKRELCARINQAWGGTLIREVKFVAPRPAASGPARITHEADIDHVPFIRRRRA